MLIDIHIIQNHSPANLNRDDLGAPKTCYFGGVLRSRISSQCLKRSIRMSDEFRQLLGAVRTRRLAQLVAADQDQRDRLFAGMAVDASAIDAARFQKATEVLKDCGIAPKESKKAEDDEDTADDKSAGLVFVTRRAVNTMAELLINGRKSSELATEFARLIAQDHCAPDMALFGRMLEPKKAKKEKGEDGAKKGEDVWKALNATVEAALQAAHAISTHEAHPEVDYYVAADDVPGQDAGAGFVDEAMFASACFYKYFSIHWEALVENLSGFGEEREKLAAHTVGGFLRGAAQVNPTGKQNSFAAHNPPDGILVEIRNTPLSYANAFARPVTVGAGIKEDGRDIASQSIAQLAQYARDIDTGYGKPQERFWFSPNLRYPLNAAVKDTENGKKTEREIPLEENNIPSINELIAAVIKTIGYDWNEVQKVVVNPGAAS